MTRPGWRKSTSHRRRHLHYFDSKGYSLCDKYVLFGYDEGPTRSPRPRCKTCARLTRRKST